MVITVRYSDGSVRNVPYVGNERSISIEGDLHALLVGDHSLTIRYYGFTASLPVQIAPANSRVENVVVTQNPSRTEYVVRNTFDWRGMIVQANYVWEDDGKPAQSRTFDAFPEHGFGPPDWELHIYNVGTKTASSMDKEGEKDVFISYMNERPEEPFGISVRIPEGAQRLEVVNAKNEYFTDDAFDVSGITVTAFDFLDHPTVIETDDPKLGIFIDGIGEIVDIANPPSFMNEGTYLVTVRYEEVDAGFTVNVTQRRITHVAIIEPPTKLEYEFGEAIDLSGLEIKAVYNNGEFYDVVYGPATGSYFSLTAEYDGNMPGEQTFGVVYRDFESGDVFTVTVKEPIVLPSATGITAEISVPVAYFDGDAFDPNGIAVTAHYKTGDRRIAAGDLWFKIDGGNWFRHDDSPQIFETSGEKTVMVSYTDLSDEEHHDSVTVSVTRTAMNGISIKTPPSAVQYTVGDAFDLGGLALWGHHNNPKTPATEIAWSPAAGIGIDPAAPDMASPAVHVLRFTYGGFTTPDFVTVTVNKAPPARVTFDAGEGSRAVIQPQFIDIGEFVVDVPTAPRAERYPFDGTGLFVGGDYIFTGWFAQDSDAPFDFVGTPITGDITLTAKWGKPDRVENIAPS
ncbi:MAG: bacterial Ig-like domain-containing protein, partial [Treponema sp.]|nr:bacterial Ig-like domain-containing protein [Treponema sp.]